MVWIPGRGVAVFGGWARDGEVFSDLWIWDGKRWEEIPRTEPWPAARVGHAMAWDPIREVLLLFGGVISKERGEDRKAVWEWGRSGWKRTQARGGPGSRSWPSAAFVSELGAVVVIGGHDPSPETSYIDMWAWRGPGWGVIPSFSQQQPAARGLAGVAYDAQQERLLLFGGFQEGSDTHHSDLWALDPRGGAWTLLHDGHRRGPGPRRSPGFVYDGQRAVLFGGQSQRGGVVSVHNDLWTWVDERWVQVPIEEGPSARLWHGMAWDGDRGVVVMFGGQETGKGSPSLGDLWELQLEAP